MKLDFSRQIFEKNTEISNFMKIRRVRAEFFHADGRTDKHVTKLIVAFRNFANAPKNLTLSSCCTQCLFLCLGRGLFWMCLPN